MASPRDQALLHDALLDFQRHPARHPVAASEPQLLFASIPAVLQIAAGRGAGEHDSRLREAACTFVRRALVYPDATHYAILGLRHGCTREQVKEHYRLMMRLMHPDFAKAASWPADAAARVNLAYEVLTSSVRRAGYDRECTPTPPGAGPAPARPARRMPAARRRGPVDSRKLLVLLAGGFGAVGAAGLAAFWFAGGERDGLIQRPFQPVSLTPTPAPRAFDPAPQAAAAAAAAALLPARTPSGRLLADTPADEAALPAAPPASAAAAPQQPATMLATAPSPPPPSPPAAPPVPAQAPPGPPAPAAQAAAAPAQLAAVGPATPAPARTPGITLADAQPLLAAVLQQLETGRGEGLLALAEREVRAAPAAQALSRHVDGLSHGRALKVSQVQFRVEPAEDRLVVIGNLQVVATDDAQGGTPRPLVLRLEFVSRRGAAAIAGLSSLGRGER